MKVSKKHTIFLEIVVVVSGFSYASYISAYEDIVLDIQALLSHETFAGTYSSFRQQLYSQPAENLQSRDLFFGPQEERWRHPNQQQWDIIFKDFERESALKKFTETLHSSLRKKIPSLSLDLIGRKNDTPLQRFLSTAKQDDSIIVVSPMQQVGPSCGFHAVMNMLMVQQYLIGNFKATQDLKKVFSAIVQSSMYKDNRMNGGVWINIWGFGAMGVFLEFLVSNLQTYSDLKKYVTSLPYNFSQQQARGMIRKIYEGLKENLLDIYRDYFSRKQKKPFYYFKIYYGHHDKEDKKYFTYYPRARNFGSLYLHEKRGGRTVRLGRDVSLIRDILEECRKKRQVIAVPILVREQQHNYSLVIAQNEEGKRMYVLTDSEYLESNRDRSFVKDLAEELK